MGCNLAFVSLCSVSFLWAWAPAVFAGSATDQRYACNIGYTQEECAEQTTVLRSVLERYHAERLGPWMWIVVKSRDWKGILAARGLDTNSPAFTYFSNRRTFIEEALLRTVPRRTAELLLYWGLPRDRLLDLAVAHELAHALCNDVDERRVTDFARLMQKGANPSCAHDKPAKELSLARVTSSPQVLAKPNLPIQLNLPGATRATQDQAPGSLRSRPADVRSPDP